MTSTTHRLPVLSLPTPSRHALALRRRLVRALTWVYADRPVTSLGSPGYAGELPSQRYAELRVLRHP